MNTNIVGDTWEIWRVRGGCFGVPFVKDVVETASSKEEAEDIVKQYRKMWGNIYIKKVAI